MHEDLRNHDRVTVERYQSKNFKRGLQEGEEAFPVIAKIGPYIVKNPVFGAKNYHWCSCGMSKNQPFCDSSHKGTVFNPLKFSLEQNVNQMFLCGCKLSSQAPFCDGNACQKLLNNEEFEYVAAENDLFSDDQEEELENEIENEESPEQNTSK